MHTEYWQNAHTKQVIRVSSRRDPRLNDGEIWLQITEAEYNAVNAHEAAEELAEALAALKLECETNSYFAAEPNESEAVALDMASTALAEWDKVTK